METDEIVSIQLVADTVYSVNFKSGEHVLVIGDRCREVAAQAFNCGLLLKQRDTYET